MWPLMSLNNNTTLYFIKNSFGKSQSYKFHDQGCKYISRINIERKHTRATEFSRLMQQVVVIGGCNLSEPIRILLEFVYIHEQGSLKVVRGWIILYKSSNFSLSLCHTLQETDYFSSCNLNFRWHDRENPFEKEEVENFYWNILIKLEMFYLVKVTHTYSVFSLQEIFYAFFIKKL